MKQITLMLMPVVVLTACAVGDRPFFEDTPTGVGTETGDESIDTVLRLLDGVKDSQFTASYQATLLFGGVVSAAQVTQMGQRRSVTIGQVRYLSEAGSSRTCVLDTAVCDDAIQAAAVSNTGLTPEFAFGDMAKRLRRDAAARVAPSTWSVEDIAGATATCVAVPVTGGTKQYCALADGTLARFRGADVELDLITYSPEFDETLFAV